MKKIIAALCLVAGAAGAADTLLITGAGATFPYPMYSKWFSEYNKLHPSLQFNYQSIGSGGGVKQAIEKTVDFGATDSAMTDEELTKAPDMVHIPTILGADVLAYNVPGVAELKLTPETLSGIFLGKITKWNDAGLAQDNPGVKLPDLAVTVAHRSDGSGTTGVFTDYLSKISPEWKTKVGAAKSVKWPVGLGGKGNEGVSGLIKQNPGTIGYVELAYANQNKMTVAQLKNQSGIYIKPTTSSISAAAAGVTLPDDLRVSITDAKGKDAYSISAFTYILLRRNQDNTAKGEAVLKFLWWAAHDGQKMAEPLDYAPLPAPVITKVEQKLKSLTVQGKPVNFAAL